MLWAVVMVGGTGTRFWPESRRDRPKQFLKVFGPKTLLEETLARLRPVVPPQRTLILTNARYVSLVRRLSKVPMRNIIGEPVGRNTAPCAALAAYLAYSRDPEAVVALLPSDHRIAKPDVFRRALRAGAALTSETSWPVTLGIQPDRPHPGYGYLETSKTSRRAGGLRAFQLKKFHEKPSPARAKKFVRSKRFLWNGGIFIWRAAALLKATQKHLPKISGLLPKVTSPSGLKRHYKNMPDISVDYGLMEKLHGRIWTLPVNMGWSDLGDWQAFAALWPKDRAGNVARGKSLFIESSGNLLKSERFVALLGVRDLVVIDTEDALLICSKSSTDFIRKVVAKLPHDYS